MNLHADAVLQVLAVGVATGALERLVLLDLLLRSEDPIAAQSVFHQNHVIFTEFAILVFFYLF